MGVADGNTLLDLDYSEDSHAEVDMNLVATDTGEMIELQGTGEQAPFDRKRLNALLDLGDKGYRRAHRASAPSHRLTCQKGQVYFGRFYLLKCCVERSDRLRGGGQVPKRPSRGLL